MMIFDEIIDKKMEELRYEIESEIKEEIERAIKITLEVNSKLLEAETLSKKISVVDDYLELGDPIYIKATKAVVHELMCFADREIYKKVSEIIEKRGY